MEIQKKEILINQLGDLLKSICSATDVADCSSHFAAKRAREMYSSRFNIESREPNIRLEKERMVALVNELVRVEEWVAKALDMAEQYADLLEDN